MAYEAKVDRGEIKLYKRMPAKDLWRKMLTMLFETGHPWITFKDACNVRSPQQHVGVVHSLQPVHRDHAEHQRHRDRGLQPGLGQPGAAPEGRRRSTRPSSSRPSPPRCACSTTSSTSTTTRSRRRATPTCATARWAWASWASRTACTSCACPTPATRRWSSPTARWRRSATTPTGPPPNWPRSAAATPATAARCGTAASCRWTRWTCWPSSAAATSRSTARRRWTGTRCASASPSTACATPTAWPSRPTATISNIIGVDASIEPCFGNLSVKSNLSGEFTVINEYLVRDLKRLGLWDDVMVMDLKHFDGSLRRIDRVPEEIKRAVRHRLRGRGAVAGRGRRAAPEVDRPGAVAQHLHGRRLGQEARRDLQAGLAARPEDHLLPAHHERHPRREVDGDAPAR